MRWGVGVGQQGLGPSSWLMAKGVGDESSRFFFELSCSLLAEGWQRWGFRRRENVLANPRGDLPACVLVHMSWLKRDLLSGFLNLWGLEFSSEMRDAVPRT